MTTVSLAIFLVFLGCASNVFFLEHLINLDPSSGNLITFGQFAFIALERFRHFSWDPKIPLQRHFLLVALFVSVAVINNWAFSFNIPLTLHIVFRAGSLVTNLILSKVILKRTFSKTKYISVATITAGIIIIYF
jgi:UDP-xylose/UDP-N-acetylglucosamine transporter B4